MAREGLLDAGAYTVSPKPSHFSGIWTFAKARPLGAACAVILIMTVLIAVFAGVLAPYSPNENHAQRLQSPSGTYLLGTDNFGRDILSRIIFGARTSVQVGLLSMTFSVLTSLSLGVTAAYFRGAWDYFVGRIVDGAQSLPAIILLIALLSVFGRSIASIGIVLGLTTGMIASRVVRGAALQIGALSYVEVARSIGCTPLRVILRYILPNVFPVVIVLATINVGAAIVAEASLSFIGYGVIPPAPSWGGMLSGDGRRFMVIAPWLFYAPVFALMVVIFCTNMVGDALRDRLDPRLRGGR